MKESHSGVAISIGTKAELIKCMPIMVELQKQNKDYWFIHTGQHSLKDACEKFGIKRPDFVLSKAPKDKNTKFWSKINRVSIFWAFLMVYKIRKKIRRLKPKYVIYHGDTMSTAVSAIATSKILNPGKAWKNVHLEAGLRSGSLFEPFPEEISRQICDNFSDILLAVSEKSKNNLNKYKNKKKIVTTGNTIVDSAIITQESGGKNNQKRKKGYALINIHRHENLKSRERMTNVIRILEEIKIDAVWPLHDNTRHYLEKYNLMGRVSRIKNIEVTPLVDYSNFILLMSNCKYLVCDGGSIQEESLVFGKPCVILRKNTERPEGLDTGINFLTKLDVSYSKRIIREIENGTIKSKKIINPYGEKGLSKKIVEILR